MVLHGAHAITATATCLAGRCGSRGLALDVEHTRMFTPQDEVRERSKLEQASNGRVRELVGEWP